MSKRKCISVLGKLCATQEVYRGVKKKFGVPETKLNKMPFLKREVRSKIPKGQCLKHMKLVNENSQIPLIKYQN